MLFNTNSYKFTVAALGFALFCIYNSGYFKRDKFKISNYYSQESIEYASRAQHQIKIDPLKKSDEKGYLEWALQKYLNFAGVYDEVKNKVGDKLRITVEENIEGEANWQTKEMLVKLGEKEVPVYIEKELLFLGKGEEKYIIVYDDNLQKKRFINIKVIDIETGSRIK